MSDDVLRYRLPDCDPADPAGFFHAVADYLAWMESHNYSHKSIIQDARVLSGFCTWAEARGLARPDQVTGPILDQYQRHLSQRVKEDGSRLAWSTQAGYMNAVRQLFKFLARQHRIAYNPAADITYPRRHYPLPRGTLSVEQVEAILAVPDLATPLGIRDRAMMEVFYLTGIRRSELRNITLRDFNMTTGTFAIRKPKNKRDRFVPVPERAMVWIRKYLAMVRPTLLKDPDTQWLFLSSLGKRMSEARLTHIVKSCMVAADIEVDGSCHVFRHTTATLMLDGGADIRYIQELLGHADISSTQVYTRVAISKLREVQARTHPGVASSNPKSGSREDRSMQSERVLGRVENYSE